MLLKRGASPRLYAGRIEGALDGAPVSHGPADSCQSGQLPTERAEDLERLVALIQQAVEEGQRIVGPAIADGIENLEGLGGPAAADKLIHVVAGNRWRVADVHRQLGKFLVEQTQVEPDHFQEPGAGIRIEPLVEGRARSLRAPPQHLIAAGRLARDRGGIRHELGKLRI